MTSTITAFTASTIQHRTAWLFATGALLIPGGAFAQSPFAQPDPLMNRSGLTTSGVVEDFDGDGTLDIVKNTPGAAAIILYRGIGGGNFEYTRQVLPPGGAGSVTQASAGDLDGDGDIDLIATSPLAPFAERLVNDGAGHFTVEVLGISGGPWSNARFADVNSDGVQDLLLSKMVSTTRLLSWVDGQGGLFNTPPQALITVPTLDLDTLDVDGDGLLDLTTFAGNGGLRVAFGLGGATFAPFAPLSGPASAAVSPLAFRDINGDGYVEIFTSRPNGFKYYQATGPRTYAAPALLAPSLDGSNSTEFLDLDGDGDLDVLHITSDSFTAASVNNADALTFYQSSPGAFTPGPPTSAAITNFASVRDINGDGLGDLLLSYVEGLQWQLGGAAPGTDYFGPTESSNLDLYSASTHVLTDLDGDGDSDVVVASDEQRRIGWLENLGAGQFAEASTLVESSTSPIEVRVMDFDSDGDQDIVALRRTGLTLDWDVVVYANDGVGTFTQVGTPLAIMLTEMNRFEVLDFNADGNADVLMSIRSSLSFRSVRLFLGDGLGQFSQVADPVPPLNGPAYLDIRSDDLNGDGLPDVTVLTPNAPGPQTFFMALNQGGGAFVSGPSVTVPIFAFWLNLTDLNQDGLLDVVTSSPGGMTLFAGTGAGTFQSGAANGGMIRARPEFVDLDADGDIDAYSSVFAFNFRTQWAEQLANGTFLPAIDLYAGNSVVREVSKFADIDGDGDLDAVVMNPSPDSGGQLRVHDNLSLADIGAPMCSTQVPNSGGAPGQLLGYGSEITEKNAVVLNATDLPPNQFGLLVGSRTFGAPMAIPGSMGHLCLSGGIGRYQGPGQIQSSGAGGSISIALDLMALSTPNGPVAGMAGDSWSFQLWHRDTVAGAATSNLTTGVSITLQ